MPKHPLILNQGDLESFFCKTLIFQSEGQKIFVTPVLNSENENFEKRYYSVYNDFSEVLTTFECLFTCIDTIQSYTLFPKREYGL